MDSFGFGDLVEGDEVVFDGEDLPDGHISEDVAVKVSDDLVNGHDVAAAVGRISATQTKKASVLYAVLVRRCCVKR